MSKHTHESRAVECRSAPSHDSKRDMMEVTIPMPLAAAEYIRETIEIGRSILGPHATDAEVLSFIINTAAKSMVRERSAVSRSAD